MDYNENQIENFSGEKEEKRSRKGGFFSGVAVTLVCLMVVCVLVTTVLGMTGQVLVIGKAGVSKVESKALLTDDIVEKIDEIYNTINIYYYEDYEKEDLAENLYKGLVNGLNDPYSVYYTKEEYEDLKVSTSGTYYGIGAGLSQDLNTMVVTITKVYRGTPAEEAGLKSGDVILYVDEWEATSMEVSELVQHIRGEEGTSVHMTVYRESTEETLEFDVERRNVELPSIEGEMLDGGIGYIQITEFQSKTDEQFVEMVENLKSQGMRGMIVDVRANPGGLLSSVVNLCNYILPEGLVVYVEDAYGNRQDYTSDAACIDMPIVVLVDENSASASEIFAGAMKDHSYATLVGKTTYGKGIVQNIIPLEDEDAIKLTTAKYFTPNGNYIHGVGIEPDVEADYNYTGSAEEPYDKQYDGQFLKGLEVMQEMLAE